MFDLVRPSVRLVLHGPTWCNVHGHCRSLDAEASHDILIQETTNAKSTSAAGSRSLVGGQGADIHVIRDDGTQFRNMPWGRDGNEFCQGHHALAGADHLGDHEHRHAQTAGSPIDRRAAAPHAGHVGIATPGGVRNDLSRGFTNPEFYHFATDPAESG